MNCWLCENQSLCPVHDADEYCKRGYHNWEPGNLEWDWICSECGKGAMLGDTSYPNLPEVRDQPGPQGKGSDLHKLQKES